MAALVDESTYVPGGETLDEMNSRHKKETREVEGKIRALLKTAKKSNRAQIETEAIKMEYDLKQRHRDEMDILEEYLSNNGSDLISPSSGNGGGDKGVGNDGQEDTGDIDESTAASSTAIKSEEEIARAKKAKAQKKREKRNEKDKARLAEKAELAASAGPSLRDEELAQINAILGAENPPLEVKEILSDGNCLYRAIADQLPPQEGITFADLRRIAANYMRSNRDDFAPFLGLESNDPEFDEYCNNVESVVKAEWGGQLEIRAISQSLSKRILIYDAVAPVLTMDGSDGSDSNPPIRLTFHRHFFSLGEHYNSVKPINL